MLTPSGVAVGRAQQHEHKGLGLEEEKEGAPVRLGEAWGRHGEDVCRACGGQ